MSVIVLKEEDSGSDPKYSYRGRRRNWDLRSLKLADERSRSEEARIREILAWKGKAERLYQSILEHRARSLFFGVPDQVPVRHCLLGECRVSPKT